MRNFIKGFILVLSVGIPLLLLLILVFLFTGQPAILQNLLPREITSIVDASAEPADTDTKESPTETAASTAAEDNVFASQDPVESDTSGTPETEPQENGTALLAFAGDVMFPDEYLDEYDRSGIQAIADENMLSHMQDADLFILNEEFPFSLRGEPMADKQFTFRTDPKYVSILQELGTDIVTLANNHALDYGRTAFEDTLETLDQAGIQRIGGGYNISEAASPAICTVQGQRFAIFGATRVSPSADWYAGENQSGLFQTYDPAKLNAAIQEAKKSCDHVIVFVHWGIEKNETPEEYQHTLAKGYIDAGADLVVGCHPHVLQGFEYYKGVPIIYSLGNFLFDSRTGQTVLLEASFSDENSPTVQLVPCQRSNGILKEMTNPSELYQKLSELSFDVSVDDNGILQPQE